MKKMIYHNEKKNSKNVSMEINIIPLLLFLVKKIWICVIVGIITAALMFTAVKLFVHPTYQCGFTAYVNNKHAAATSNTEFLTASDVNAAKELVKTYSAIIKSNTILSTAKETMKLNYSVKQLNTMVSTRIQDETEIIQVYVVANSPEESYRIASAIASVAPKNMADIVEGSSMKIVEYPQVPDGIYKPSYVKFTLIGFGVGFLITMLVFIIMYLKNDTVSDEAEIESRFSVPVLGVIPDTNDPSGGKSGYYYQYYYQEKEADSKKAKDKKESDTDKGDRQVEKA